jgi:hypothetical protein
VNFSGFYRSLGYIYLPNKKKSGKKGAKKGGKKDVKKATVNSPIVLNIIHVTAVQFFCGSWGW